MTIEHAMCWRKNGNSGTTVLLPTKMPQQSAINPKQTINVTLYSFLLAFLSRAYGHFGHSLKHRKQCYRQLSDGWFESHVVTITNVFLSVPFGQFNSNFYNEYVIQALILHKLQLSPAAQVSCFANYLVFLTKFSWLFSQNKTQRTALVVRPLLEFYKNKHGLIDESDTSGLLPTRRMTPSFSVKRHLPLFYCRRCLGAEELHRPIQFKNHHPLKKWQPS